MKTLLFCLISFFAFQTMASLPGLSTAYSRHIRKTQSAILQKNLLSDPSPTTCHGQVVNMANSKTIKIYVGFGYMDVSNGQDFNDSSSSMYGAGDVLDLDAKTALENILVSDCPSHGGQKLMACGFSQKSGKLVKRIRNRFSQSQLSIEITLQAPSVSSKDINNRTSQKQKRSSDRSRNLYLSALQTHDVVLYLGHARSGGGPDFYPPVLNSQGRVDYVYYKNQQQGIGEMLSALRGASVKPSVLGVLACKSTGLFSNRIRKVASDSILVTAGELFDYNDILPTGYAMIEAVVSQRCTDSFNRVTKVQPASSGFLKIFF